MKRRHVVRVPCIPASCFRDAQPRQRAASAAAAAAAVPVHSRLLAHNARFIELLRQTATELRVLNRKGAGERPMMCLIMHVARMGFSRWLYRCPRHVRVSVNQLNRFSILPYRIRGQIKTATTTMMHRDWVAGFHSKFRISRWCEPTVWWTWKSVDWISTLFACLTFHSSGLSDHSSRHATLPNILSSFHPESKIVCRFRYWRMAEVCDFLQEK